MTARLLALVLFISLAVFVGLFAVLGSPIDTGVLVVNDTIGRPMSTDATPVHFVVRPGASATVIGDQLQSNGIIRSGLAFRAIVRLKNLDSNIEAGDYELKPSSDVAAIVSVFASGKLVGGMLTIPEGWRALEIADALDRAGITSRSDFLHAVSQPAFSIPSTLDLPKGRSLEGFLYPDSYRFEPHSDASVVTERLAQNFAAHLSPSASDAYRFNGLDLTAAVTLASIIEREALVPTERPIIASVYLNRIHRGMKLQADPTVQFALVRVDGLPSRAAGYWKAPLTLADLSIASPYNTYRTAGLPPGPICSPGAASLEAVAHPATTDYLYFVARPDGSHAFARTLEEHQKNVATYQASGGG